MHLFQDIRALEDQGIDLVGILGGDVPLGAEELAEILRRLPRGSESQLYQELLYFLTYRRFEASEAEQLWKDILKHRQRLTQELGRRVQFRTAALDYLGSVRGVLRQVKIIAKQEFEEVLAHVDVDELTQAFNRRFFNQQLEREFNRSRRYADALSLVFVDVNAFKGFNDRFGHPAGDAALSRVARDLRQNVRETDMVCRYGGDEFAIICPTTSDEDARRLGERLARIQTVAETPEGEEVPLGISIGIATYPDDADSPLALVEAADQNLYGSKPVAKQQKRA